MKEEQRYAQQLQIEKDRNTCLKGIWDELKVISGLLKVQTGVSPASDVANFSSTIEEDLEELKEKLYKQRDGDYRGAKFNGEWHGEFVDPSDPSRK